MQSGYQGSLRFELYYMTSGIHKGRVWSTVFCLQKGPSQDTPNQFNAPKDKLEWRLKELNVCWILCNNSLDRNNH